MRFLLLAALLTSMLPAQNSYRYYVSGDPADVVRPTRPGYLLAGGSKDVDAAFRWFLARAGGGDVVVLRASGADGYHAYFQQLATLHSVETIVFTDPAAARDPFVLGKIHHAEAIFFAGGDQWNYIRYWHKTPVAEALAAAIRRGIPIGGTSAGLAILGEYAFSAEFDTVTTPQALADPQDKRVALFRGLLAIPGLECLITDSHFTQRHRLGRLLVFLKRIHEQGRCPQVRGIGIDERTAVLWDGEGRAEVVGEGSAHLVQFRGEDPMPIRAVPAGATFDWKQWEQGPEAYRIGIRGPALVCTGNTEKARHNECSP